MLLCLVVTVTMIKAQRYSKLNKPIVNLNARPQATTTPKLPEERRKLSIFPKNMAKYVITTKPYSKVRSYSPWEVSTKKPLMRKLVPIEAKTSRPTPVTKPYLMEVTYKPIEKHISSEIETDKEEQFMIIPNGNRMSPRLSKVNNHFVARDFEPEGEETEQVFAVSTSDNNKKINHVSSTESNEIIRAVNKAVELDNSRRKRLSVRNFGYKYNTIDTSHNADNFLAEEKRDENEFIFLNEKLKPEEDRQSDNIVLQDEDQEIATEIVWLEESTPAKLRHERYYHVLYLKITTVII